MLFLSAFNRVFAALACLVLAHGSVSGLAAPTLGVDDAADTSNSSSEQTAGGSFAEQCAEQLDSQNTTAVTADAYSTLVSTLSRGQIQAATFQKLPLSLIASFHASACFDGRPCVGPNAAIDVSTAEDQFRACHILEASMDQAMQELSKNSPASSCSQDEINNTCDDEVSHRTLMSLS